MKLSKVSYGSAVYFGFFTLVMYLVLGILQLALTSSFGSVATGVASPVQALITVPLIGGIASWAFMIFAIWIYNFISKKGYPITWEVKK